MGKTRTKKAGFFYDSSGKEIKSARSFTKSLSYNNYLDVQSAVRVISEFITNPKAPHLTSIIKHNNPCEWKNTPRIYPKSMAIG